MNRICLVLLAALVFAGCSQPQSPTARQKLEAKGQEVLVGSWTNKDKNKFLEITKGGSIVISKKDSSDEKIGFYKIELNKIHVFKDENAAEGRTEICRFEILSDNIVVFGENEEYWNVLNLSGKWFRDGTDMDVDQVIAAAEYAKLSPDEKKLADIKLKRIDCEKLVQDLKSDREGYLAKLVKIDEAAQPDSWKLNASMLAKTKKRMRNADYELKKLKRAEEALEILIADKDRAEAIKKAGLDEEGLRDLLRSIGETEDQLPVDEESDFSLKMLVEEELKSFKADQTKK